MSQRPQLPHPRTRYTEAIRVPLLLANVRSFLDYFNNDVKLFPRVFFEKGLLLYPMLLSNSLELFLFGGLFGGFAGFAKSFEIII